MKSFNVKTDNENVRKEFLRMMSDRFDGKWTPTLRIIEVGEMKKIGKEYQFEVKLE